jgi:hypothetical protein
MAAGDNNPWVIGQWATGPTSAKRHVSQVCDPLVRAQPCHRQVKPVVVPKAVLNRDNSCTGASDLKLGNRYI